MRPARSQSDTVGTLVLSFTLSMSMRVAPRWEVAMSDDDEAAMVRITGRVQGVGFRAWTREEAEELGLTGWSASSVSGTVRPARRSLARSDNRRRSRKSRSASGSPDDPADRPVSRFSAADPPGYPARSDGSCFGGGCDRKAIDFSSFKAHSESEVTSDRAPLFQRTIEMNPDSRSSTSSYRPVPPGL
jgi:acylphosphatase